MRRRNSHTHRAATAASDCLQVQRTLTAKYSQAPTSQWQSKTAHTLLPPPSSQSRDHSLMPLLRRPFKYAYSTKTCLFRHAMSRARSSSTYLRRRIGMSMSPFAHSSNQLANSADPSRGSPTSLARLNALAIIARRPSLDIAFPQNRTPVPANQLSNSLRHQQTCRDIVHNATILCKMALKCSLPSTRRSAISLFRFAQRAARRRVGSRTTATPWRRLRTSSIFLRTSPRLLDPPLSFPRASTRSEPSSGSPKRSVILKPLQRPGVDTPLHFHRLRKALTHRALPTPRPLG